MPFKFERFQPHKKRTTYITYVMDGDHDAVCCGEGATEAEADARAITHLQEYRDELNQFINSVKEQHATNAEAKSQSPTAQIGGG